MRMVISFLFDVFNMQEIKLKTFILLFFLVIDHVYKVHKEEQEERKKVKIYFKNYRFKYSDTFVRRIFSTNSTFVSVGTQDSEHK